MKRNHHIAPSLLSFTLFFLLSCVEENTFDAKQYVLSFTPMVYTNVSTLSFTASDISTVTVDITCNSSWGASSSDSWLTVGPPSGWGNAQLKVWVTRNSDSSPRTGTITVVCRGITKTISVTQAGFHECVDLGLPSGLLWATTNVGAEKPEDYGDYFAWGETTTKSTYWWDTYKWCNGSDSTLTKYNTSSDYGTVDSKTILELSDDAANVNWGDSWRMPMHNEWAELCNTDYCIWTWTTRGGHNGYEVTSKSNGNSIFLPAAGYCWDTYLSYHVGDYGEYWSSSLREGDPDDACDMTFNSGGVYGRWSYFTRYYGFSVRPVCRP